MDSRLHLPKNAACPGRSVIGKHLLETARVEGVELAAHIGQHGFRVFGQVGQVVQHIEQQVFAIDLLARGKARLVAKVEFKPGQVELAMTLVVIDDGLVVKLSGAEPQSVVAARVEHQEMMVIEKLFDERLLAWRCIAKRSPSGDVIEPLCSLSHGSGLYSQTELPINAG